MTPAAVIGIDVGGTLIKSAVITPAGTVLDEMVLPTPEHIGDSIGSVTADIVRGHLARLADRPTAPGLDLVSIAAVGVVVPGVVDDVLGIGRYSSNLGWRDLDLRALIGREVDLPLAVGHDVRAGLLAEHRFGAAVGAANVVFVPLGTGIASAVLSGGRLLADPRSGEIGHVMVRPDGPTCGCGSHGCLETIASARAIGRRFTERLLSVGGPSLPSARSALPDPAAPATAADVADLVAAATAYGSNRGGAGVDSRTRAALEVWHEAVEALAAVLAPVVMALGTETVLVGGGLVRSGETLLAPLRQAVAVRLGAGLTVDVRPAALGDRAGSLGAGVLALEVIGA